MHKEEIGLLVICIALVENRSLTRLPFDPVWILSMIIYYIEYRANKMKMFDETVELLFHSSRVIFGIPITYK